MSGEGALQGLTDRLGKFTGTEAPQVGDGLVRMKPGLWIAAFDTALARSGVAIIETLEDRINVITTAIIETPGDEKADYEVNFQRGVDLRRKYRATLATLHRLDIAVHEMPSVMGGPAAAKARKGREGRIIACTAFRCAFEDVTEAQAMPPKLVGIYSQEVKKTLTGNAKAEKAAVRAAVQRHSPGITERTDLRLNEDTYDAMGLGMTAAHKEI